MADYTGNCFVGLMRRLPGIHVPAVEVSTAREHLLVNTLMGLRIGGFDEDFKRFILPMTMIGVATGVIQAEYLAVYQLLKPAPDMVLLDALEAIDEDARNPAEVNVWQYLIAFATSAKQSSYRSLTSATLGFVRGIDGMIRTVSGTMRGDGLFFTSVMSEEEPSQERSLGDRLLGHTPPQREFSEFFEPQSYAPFQQMEAPSVRVS
jgi:hypothetical protein